MKARKRTRAHQRAAHKETRVALAAFARFPEVLQALASVRPLRAIVVEVGCTTLQIEGHHLTSAYDRETEAQVQASRIDPESPEATVYGVALGDLPTLLLMRPKLLRLRVVMLDVAVVATTLAYQVDHGWALDPRVELVLGVDETSIQRPFTVAPAALALCDVASAKLRDALMLDLVAPFQAAFAAGLEPLVQSSLSENAEMLHSDRDVQLIFGTRPGGRALVAAGGPTLSESMDFIREQRAGVVLIAVTTALRPLFAAGLRPDFAVAIDPLPELTDHFNGLPTEWMVELPLVYIPAVHPSALKAWPGPRYGGYLAHPRYRELRSTIPRATLFCSGTVTHTAIDLAVQMGSAEVILLGVDFAYAGGRTHAIGASDERGAPAVPESWVIDGNGQRVASTLALVGYLRDLESYIAAHKDVRFRLKSRRGARIEGTTWI